MLIQGHETQETRQEVAVKTVSRASLKDTTKLVENLRGEIDILKSLSHRHITRLIDIVVRILCLSHEVAVVMPSWTSGPR